MVAGLVRSQEIGACRGHSPRRYCILMPASLTTRPQCADLPFYECAEIRRCPSRGLGPELGERLLHLRFRHLSRTTGTGQITTVPTNHRGPTHYNGFINIRRRCG